jgi:NADH dehydrogenase FAD-containing subunit
VEEDGVWLQCKDQPDLQKLTAGTMLWATGIKMNPLSTAIAAAMPDGQQVCCLSTSVSGARTRTLVRFEFLSWPLGPTGLP